MDGERLVIRWYRVEFRFPVHFCRSNESVAPAMTEDGLHPFDLAAGQRNRATADFAGASILSDGWLGRRRAASWSGTTPTGWFTACLWLP